MQKQWFVISEKFEKLNNREKYLVLFAGVIITYLLISAILFDTNQSQLDRINRSVTQLKSSNSTLTLETAKAQVELANDPNKDLDKQIAIFQEKLNGMDNELLSLTNELITPDKMRVALQDMLHLTPGIELVAMSSIAPEPLIKDQLRTKKANSEEAGQAIDLYRHTIQLTLEGSYFQLRDYLKNIEGLSWSFYWHEFDYSVTEYPKATLNIQMYSLSTTKEFIGV